MAYTPYGFIVETACICILSVTGGQKNQIKSWIKDTADLSGIMVCVQDVDHIEHGLETKGLMLWTIATDWSLSIYDTKVRLIRFAEEFRLQFGYEELHFTIFNDYKSARIN